MGNTPSMLFGDGWWNDVQNNSESTSSASAIQERISPKTDNDKLAPRELSEENKERLNEFKLEQARKHEKRRQILADKRKEMEELREEVIRLKKENQVLKEASLVKTGNVCDDLNIEMDRLRKDNEGLKELLAEKSRLLEASDDLIAKNRELRLTTAAMQRDLQNLNKQVIDFDKERQDYKTHVIALKDVISVSKHMLQIRESQLKELKEKVESIEQSLAGREMNILSQDLKNEYERQLENIRNLRALYEERQRVHKREKDALINQLDDVKKELSAEQNKVSELGERIKTLEDDNSKKYDEIKTLESNLGLSKAESRQYQAELTVINQLFSEILLGFNSSQDINLDKLQKQLEDHRDLLQDIVVNEISPEVSYALPKVLLELLSQLKEGEETSEEGKEEEEVNEKQSLETIKEESESQTSSVHQMNSAEEIVENLPKVWKVLIELLSHQKAPTNSLTDDEETDNPCYKTVQTPKGPSLVLSVSQTFIRLKDLILEKKSLEKETNHLKQLNGHLENRLQDQEKRLELVQSELSKTWLVVGKLQKQHQMLHTQEKILRYELAQKRKLLTELKEELEYSREKWTQAREKNSNTEQQWRLLRTEFASRRTVVPNDNSVESGFSDDRECSSSDEEPGYETDISECAQKASSDDVEELSDTKGSVTLNVMGGETVEIVCLEPSSSNDGDHSIEKTDLVHGENEAEKKTSTIQEEDILLKNVPEEVAGYSQENVRIGNKEVQAIAFVESEATSDRVRTIPEPETNLDRLEAKTVDYRTEPNSDATATTTSQENTDSKQSLEEVLAHRDERLRRLEGQAQQLVSKVTNTASKSVVISNKLDDLHEVYGQSSSEANSNEHMAAPSLDESNEVPSTDLNLDVIPNEDNRE